MGRRFGLRYPIWVPAHLWTLWLNKYPFLTKFAKTGALAAVMQAKFGGSIGVAVGSGGPGATHLINSVYDAAMDNTPFLAILGSRQLTE